MKKKIVSIVAVAVMVLAAGCGNSGRAQSQPFTAKSSTVQSKNSTAKSSATQNQSENVAYNMGRSKNEATFNGFTAGDYSFSDINVKYLGEIDGESKVSLTMTYKGSVEKYVEKLWFIAWDEYSIGRYEVILLKKTIVPGESIELSENWSRDVTLYEKIGFYGDTEPGASR